MTRPLSVIVAGCWFANDLLSSVGRSAMSATTGAEACESHLISTPYGPHGVQVNLRSSLRKELAEQSSWQCSLVAVLA